MASSMRERSMPLVFEVHNGHKSSFLLYERVLKDRACGRRVINQAMDELDAWRKKYGRLFQLLPFADWRGLIDQLDQLRGGRPKGSLTHARARKDRRYAQETFYQAIAKIDDWRRMYGYLFDRLKHTAGRTIAQAIDEVCNPEGSRVFYVWDADD